MRVEGVDAVMLFARDPGALADWYARHLGIRTRRNPDDGRYYGDVPDERPLLRHVAALLDAVGSGTSTAATRRRAAVLARRLKDMTAGPRSVHFGIYPLSASGVGARPAVMVNYRVGALPDVLRRLRSAGMEILDEEREPYGSFAHLRDPEGNLLELWMEHAPPPRRRTPAAAKTAGK